MCFTVQVIFNSCCTQQLSVALVFIIIIHIRTHKILLPHTVSAVEKLTNRTTGTLPVRSRYGHGTVAVRSRCGRGTVEVRSRCVRYSLGTLPVRSLYGILKVLSRLVFSTLLEPGTRTVRFIVRITQSRLAGFGSAIDTIPLIRNV